MFYDDFLSSLTNSFYASSNSNDDNSLSKFIENVDSIYLLGKLYKKPIKENELQDDIASRFWFTYRKGYNNIGGYGGPDSDQGWGCMIRCGQMLLAECLLRIQFGRDFKWMPKLNDEKYWELLSYFRDEKSAPYSVQQIATMGESSEGISIGKWFGPNAIVQVLNKLSMFDDSNHLRFYIAMDNCIYIDAIYDLMKNCNKTVKCKKHLKNSSYEWDPLVLILPLRLGLNEFNEEYKNPVKRCFELEQIIGMIGGKPNSAYYFYGATDDSLLYLDPHEVQNYEQNLINDKNDLSYHSKTLWKLKFSNLDPSVAIAFLCKNENEFKNLIKNLEEHVLNTSTPMNTLFEIFDKKPCYDVEPTNFETFNKSEDEYVLL